MLEDIKYYELTECCWCAIAQLIPPNPQGNPYLSSDNNTLALQRLGVRQLCGELLSHLQIQDELDDSKYPYRLNRSGYYVCFSHSKDYVAVILHSQHPVAIDLEMGDVSMAVAARFYHKDDLLQLQQIAPKQQANVCRLLWQLKECVVKIQQTLLIPTLGQNHATYVASFTQLLALNSLRHLRSDSDLNNDITLSSDRDPNCDSYQDFTQLNQLMTLNAMDYHLAVLQNPNVIVIY